MELPPQLPSFPGMYYDRPPAPTPPPDPAKPKAKITTAAWPFWKIPKCRLAEVLEMILNNEKTGGYDCTVMAMLGPMALSALIWLFTCVQPCMKLSDFRKTYYEEIYDVCIKAAKRQEKNDPTKYDRLLAALAAIAIPWQDDDVFAFAQKEGFLMEWFGVATKGKKRKAELPTTVATPLAPKAAAVPAVATASPQPIMRDVHRRTVTQTEEILRTAALTGMHSGQSQQPSPMRQLLLSDLSPMSSTPTAAPTTPAITAATPATATPATATTTTAAAADSPSPPWTALHCEACHQPFGSATTEVLQCGHILHTACLDRLVTEKGLARSACCPHSHSSAAEPPAGQAHSELECRICHDTFGEQQVEALLCGHVFHTDCINNYCRISDKTRQNCCPFKCHAASIDVAFDEDDDDDDDRTPTTVTADATTETDASAADRAAAAAEMQASIEGLT